MTTQTVLGRASRRALFWAALALGVGIGVSVWQLQAGEAAQASLPAATAIRDNLIVSVGGVGRIVEARPSAQLVVPTAAGGGGSASGSAAPGVATGGALVPAGAVFPRAAGHIKRFLVAPGERVSAGQTLALLDDGGLAAAAVKQAKIDLRAAVLELEQKRTSDPLNGLPATSEEFGAARLGVTLASERLARLLGRPSLAEVNAVRLDVKRAKADLKALLGGSPAAQGEAIRIAELSVQLAQERLNRILAPPNPADVSAAEAEVKKAQADLAILQKPPPGPLPEQIAAANLAVTATKSKLQQLRDSEADSADISVAEAEVKKAEADLAALRKPAPGPLPEEIAAAQHAVTTAQLKLTKLLQPPDPADVTAARLELERAQVELRTLRTGPSAAALAAARQAVASSRARLVQLLGPPARADVTVSQLDVRRAEADLAALRTRGAPASQIEIAVARLKVKAAQARLANARAAKHLLTVRAPSDGTLTALLTEPGATVDASSPIATVVDLDHLAVNVDLSEFDVAQVTHGLKAVVSVDALGGKSFPGNVLFVAPAGTDAGGVVTFPVQVSLAAAGSRVKPGMNVSVRIIVALRRNVVQVPLEAVSRDENDRPIVTVINASDETSPRRVTLGLAGNTSVEIVKGLRAGERVLLTESQAEGSEEDERA